MRDGLLVAAIAVHADWRLPQASPPARGVTQVTQSRSVVPHIIRFEGGGVVRGGAGVGRIGLVPSVRTAG